MLCTEMHIPCLVLKQLMDRAAFQQQGSFLNVTLGNNVNMYFKMSMISCMLMYTFMYTQFLALQKCIVAILPKILA